MLPIARFTISGHSMEPFIKNGQTVLVSLILYLISKPKIGDIVAFRKDEKVLIKRITKIGGEKYFVRGDNKNDSMDSKDFGWIEKEKIIGRVILNF